MGIHILQVEHVLDELGSSSDTDGLQEIDKPF